MLQTANSMADEMLGLPSSLKNSAQRKLKTYNPAMHGMVRGRMDDKRQEMHQAFEQLGQPQ